MATHISIDVYEFSTGMALDRKVTKGFAVADIENFEEASIYNFKNEHFSGVRSKITENWAGVLKDHYVAQTVSQIQALIDA